jgi:hypothetical protein
MFDQQLSEAQAVDDRHARRCLLRTVLVRSVVSRLDLKGYKKKEQIPKLNGLYPLIFTLYYFRLAITSSSASLGGRTRDSGSLASGSSTTFSRSMKLGRFVST